MLSSGAFQSQRESRYRLTSLWQSACRAGTSSLPRCRCRCAHCSGSQHDSKSDLNWAWRTPKAILKAKKCHLPKDLSVHQLFSSRWIISFIGSIWSRRQFRRRSRSKAELPTHEQISTKPTARPFVIQGLWQRLSSLRKRQTKARRDLDIIEQRSVRQPQRKENPILEYVWI